MYQEFYGLSGKPFQLSPDVRFFFPSKEHKRALSFLEYGLEQADGFIVITGDVGTGKTMLVQQLLENLDPHETSVATVVTTQIKEDDLLQLAASGFGLRVSPGVGKAQLLRDLERLCLQQVQEGRRMLLVVDEAQNLPKETVEELRMLSNFQRNGRPLMQVFLLGQEEFRTTLLSPGFEQLRQRVIATYHLSPLDADETRTYIEHRLTTVGWTGDPEITDEAFEAIFRFSDGVPRRINNLCDRLLLFTFLEELHRIDGEVVESVAEEIGSEFWSGRPDVDDIEVEEPRSQQVFDKPGDRLETMARSMFDKANVQQRLAALERAVDSLGHALKPEVSELREEMAYVRGLLEDVLVELRAQSPSDPASKRPVQAPRY
ncbi:MAG: XrtA-associated ATPase [Roseibium album]|uniref:XrtA/PEP-CTERM system-associated ATPase n=1 Tax=Roseibium album TaxID=311410 RepID=UPI0032EC189C